MTHRISLKQAVPIVALVLAIVGAVPLVRANAAGLSATLSITGLSGATDVTTFDATSIGYAIEGAASTTSTGAGTGKATFGPLAVRHELKPAQTLILNAAAGGRHLRTVEVTVKMDGSTLATFTLSDAVIAKASMTGKSASPETSFDYRSITITVRGSTFCWDISLNGTC